MSWFLIGHSKAKRCDKGIKVPPGETFQFRVQEEGCSIYVFEAGIDPQHAPTITNKCIHIYVIHNETKIFIATLSSSCAKVQLDLMMTEGIHLSHTSLRKVVYFNTFEFKPMPLHMSSLFKTDKELWVAKVKPFQETAFNPMDDGKNLHLLKAFSAEVTEEGIDLHVRYRDKYEKIGTLAPNGTSYFGNLEYDSEFKLSHTSRFADVIFFGYTVPDRTSFELRELKGVSVTNQKIFLRPPKKSDDPEYSVYKELVERRAAQREGVTASRKGDAGHQALKLTNIS